MPEVQIIEGDSEHVLASLEADSVHAVVTDPDYEFPLLNAEWVGSGTAYRQEFWAQVLRVLKPGGHVVSFGGARTSHRLATALENAGFEIRESLAWLYGTGFSKSADVSKLIDKRLGVERTEFVGEARRRRNAKGTNIHFPAQTETDTSLPKHIDYRDTAPATPEAAQWQGWGTSLKPAHEPIVVARKPVVESIVGNVLTHGVGALNLEACRVQNDPQQPPRIPTNVLLDESQAARLDEDTARIGGASRFFYIAKVRAQDRPTVDGVFHPTNKPISLMRYLVRLVTPLGGLVLDPFAGSGSTAEACVLEGVSCVAVERESRYLPLIQYRIDRANETLTTEEQNA